MSQERPNSLTGAEAMVHMLKAYGVKHIFGLCGDTSLPFYDALFRLDHGIDHILTRDERCAAYMADGYARVTNRIGVCEGPSGGGATYIAPGLVEANESSVPILAINSDVSTTSTGRYPLTELDQKALFRPLTKWNGVLDNAATLPRMVRTAFRAMTTGRPGAAHLAFPIDVQRAETPPDELWADPAHQSYPAWASAPDPANVAIAIELLLKSSSPMIICGGGPVISGAMDELQRFVERLDLPVATSVSGKGVIAETHPNCLGVVGSNGGCDAATAAVAAADLVIFIGCRAGSVTTERWSIPKAGAKIIHIDSDPMVIGASFDTDVALVGDARLALAAFNMLLDGLGDRDMPGGFNGGAVAAKVQTARQTRFRELATSDATPILPERVVDALNRLLPDNSVVVADPGTPCPYMSAYLTMKKPGRRYITNRAHGALGYALSASMGAHIGRPDAKTVSIMGDGSFAFTAGEFETVVRRNMPITFIVFSNSVFGWIKAGQKSGFGKRFFSVDFNRTDHAAVASAYGIKSWRVEQPGELDAALTAALAHDGPSLVDVISQPLQDAAAPVSEWIA
ncbi:thiamine pyrophosphate-binding protein [Alphaproteobacteria bacterium HT1-32]|nr:thiamine pyrophosphate-binding protein [Alphaproteobacteria bacterium HT1-32]